MKDPVRGTLQVTACSRPPSSAMSANFALNGIVTAEGVAPTAVEHKGIARTRKWPQPGQLLPVTVDRADPTRLRIKWEEVEDGSTRARRMAEQIADDQRHGKRGSAATDQPRPIGVDFTHTTTESTTIDASSVPGLRADILQITQATAQDPALMQRLIEAKLTERGVLTPDGAPGPAASVTTGSAVPPSTERKDPAERLRALDKLRHDGLVGDDEYQRLRFQILTDL